MFFLTPIDRPFLIYKQTFWYFIASYGKINIKILNFRILSSKTRIFDRCKCILFQFKDVMKSVSLSIRRQVLSLWCTNQPFASHFGPPSLSWLWKLVPKGVPAKPAAAPARSKKCLKLTLKMSAFPCALISYFLCSLFHDSHFTPCQCSLHVHISCSCPSHHILLTHCYCQRVVLCLLLSVCDLGL